MMTLFEKIASGEIPAEVVYSDDLAVAFRDINPVAPFHILVIPRQPIPGVAEVTPADQALLGHLLVVASRVAREAGVEASGYRLVINQGAFGGQVVPHLHIHVLSGSAPARSMI